MLYRRSAGAWSASQLLSREAGAYSAGPMTYRKVAGAWVTDATLTTSLDATTASAAGSTAAKTTGSITTAPAGGAGPYTYAWSKLSGGAIVADSPGAATTTFTATGLAAGESRAASFRCKVTDSFGNVVNTDTVTVTVARWSQPAVGLTPAGPISATDTTASISTASVATAVTGGTAPFTYAWAKVSGGAITADSPGGASTKFTAATLASGGESRTATFRCTVTDAHGLTATADISMTIARQSKPIASVDFSSRTASGSTSTLTTPLSAVSVAGGTAPYSYNWQRILGSGITATAPNSASSAFTATSLTSGETRSATFECTVTDANGLTDAVQVSVNIGRTSGVTASRTPASLTGSGTASTVTTSASCTASASGGQGPYSFAWSKVSGGAITAVSGTSASTAFRATGLANGESRTATFKCTVTDNLGQTADTSTVTVTITNTASTGATYSPAPGTYNVSDSGTVSFTVDASASVPWTWSGGGVATSNVASGDSASSITVTVHAGLRSDPSDTVTVQSGGNTWVINMQAFHLS